MFLSFRPSVASGGICCTASPFIERGMENRSCYRKRSRCLFHSSFLCSNAGSSRMLSCHLERQSRGLIAKADSSTPVLRTSARNDSALSTFFMSEQINYAQHVITSVGRLPHLLEIVARGCCRVGTSPVQKVHCRQRHLERVLQKITPYRTFQPEHVVVRTRSRQVLEIRVFGNSMDIHSERELIGRIQPSPDLPPRRDVLA